MNLTRREALLGGASAVCAFALGGPAAVAAPKGGKPAITTFRSATCGCCMKWVDAAKAAGFPVKVIETSDIWAVKTKLGVPQDLASCHTSQVGGYVVEGHMPLKAIERLLRERPKGIAGIGLAGMPAGSPGMEVPSGRKDPLNVMAFNRAGAMAKFTY